MKRKSIKSYYPPLKKKAVAQPVPADPRSLADIHDVLSMLPVNVIETLVGFLDAGSQYNLLHCTTRFALQTSLWKYLCIARFKTSEPANLSKKKEKATVWPRRDVWRMTFVSLLKKACYVCSSRPGSVRHPISNNKICNGCSSLPSMEVMTLTQAGEGFLLNAAELSTLQKRKTSCRGNGGYWKAAHFMWKKDVIQLAVSKYGDLDTVASIKALPKSERTAARTQFTRKFTLIREKDKRERAAQVKHLKKQSHNLLYCDIFKDLLRTFIDDGTSTYEELLESYEDYQNRESVLNMLMCRYPHDLCLEAFEDDRIGMMLREYIRSELDNPSLQDIELELSHFASKWNAFNTLTPLPGYLRHDVMHKIKSEGEAEDYVRLAEGWVGRYEKTVLPMVAEGYAKNIVERLFLTETDPARMLQLVEERTEVAKRLEVAFHEGTRSSAADDLLALVTRKKSFNETVWKPLLVDIVMEQIDMGSDKAWDPSHIGAIWKERYGNIFSWMTGKGLKDSLGKLSAMFSHANQDSQ